MIATTLCRARWSAIVIAMALAIAGCRDDGAAVPAPPETVAAVPVPAVTPQEDRGQKKSDDAATPAADDGAFTNVDSGEAERAASQRGHQSAGEKAPGSP